MESGKSNGKTFLPEQQASPAASIVSNHSVESHLEEDVRDKVPTDKLFKLAIRFNKETLLKVSNPSYEERISLASLLLQSRHGAFTEEKSPQCGTFDIVGRDRKYAWQQLENMTKTEAQCKFIDLVGNICPRFWVFVQAITTIDTASETASKTANGIASNETDNGIKLNGSNGNQGLSQEEIEEEKRNEQKKTIQEALNRQTYQQFKAYAEQQYPGEELEQESLIRQLQEQHYLQYMQQIYQSQRSLEEVANSVRSSAATSEKGDEGNINQSAPPGKATSTSSHSFDSSSVSPEVDDKDEQSTENATSHVSTEDEDRKSATEVSETNANGTESGSTTSKSKSAEKPACKSYELAHAEMWTRKDVDGFKNSVASDGQEGIIRVGHGEVVTIRVPTHEEGKFIFWEFATDDYDIGFGLLFEWTDKPGTQVSVHITESDSETEEDDLGTVPSDNHDDLSKDLNGVEKGMGNSDTEKIVPGKPNLNISVIEPLYRRDSHLQVFNGSHRYPSSHGVYLLRFDNSYSMWRSKTLYYKVYYTK